MKGAGFKTRISFKTALINYIGLQIFTKRATCRVSDCLTRGHCTVQAWPTVLKIRKCAFGQLKIGRIREKPYYRRPD